MVILGIIGILSFLLGSMVLAGFSGWLGARSTRSGVFWVPVALLYSLLLQTAHLSAWNLLRCIWFVDGGDAPFLNRYLDLVSHELPDCLKFGAMFGVIGWVWCLKQFPVFFEQERASAEARDLR